MGNNRVVSFGEIMLRLSPVLNGSLSQASTFDACYGGSEANVMICMSCLGDEVNYTTALPDNELGTAVLYHLHKYQVKTDQMILQGDTLGSYYLESGFGQRAGKVIYNRRYSEVSKLDAGAYDSVLDALFDGCKIFHISGISFALSDSCQRLCFQMMEEAKKRGILISFDFNYRSKLWSIEEAGKVYRKIADYVDIMFCANADLEVFLQTTLESYLKTATCQYVVVRNREVESSSKHHVEASIYRKSENEWISYQSPQLGVDVLDRVGSGDAFTAGVLHGILNQQPKTNEDLQECLDFGLACFCLKHTVPGDILTMSQKTIVETMKNFSKDVAR